MITKQRLEELIKQGATVYYFDSENVCAVELSEKFEFVYPAIDDDIYLMDNRETGDSYVTSLFRETKEEAERDKWKYEFGNIERIERLELPTWEELQNGTEYGCEIFFMGFDEEKEPMQYVLDVRPDDKIYIGFAKEVGAKLLDIEFEAPTTKENYILACSKAKQLFLGESE